MRRGQLRKRAYQLLDAVVYACAVAALIFGGSAVVSTILFGGDWTGAVFIMFLVGWVMVAYGTFQLRPEPPWTTEHTDQGMKIKRTDTSADKATVGSRTETRFQATMQRLPPLRWYSLPPDERLPVSAKVFLSGVAVLVASYVVELLIESFLV